MITRESDKCLTFNKKKKKKTLKTNNLFFVNQTRSIKRDKFNFYGKEKI